MIEYLTHFFRCYRLKSSYLNMAQQQTPTSDYQHIQEGGAHSSDYQHIQEGGARSSDYQHIQEGEARSQHIELIPPYLLVGSIQGVVNTYKHFARSLLLSVHEC